MIKRSKLVWILEFWLFGFVSDFEFRVSNLIAMKKITLLLISFGLLVILGITGIFLAKIVFFNHANPSIVQPSIKTPTPIEPTPAIKINANLKNLPGSVKTYQLKPPPFEIFGFPGQMAIAKALGFTANAQTYLNGNLTFYLENGKTLVINPSLGTITYNNHPPSPKATGGAPRSLGEVGQDSARQKVLDFFQNIKLTSSFWGWEDAKITAFDKNNSQTALTSQTQYFRLEPTLRISEIPLTPLSPILADVSINGDLQYLSFWYPNLVSDNSKIIKIPNQKELQKMINEKNTIIQGPQNEWPKTIDSLKLIYELPKFLDYAEPVFLEPTLVFTNGKATVKFKLY